MQKYFLCLSFHRNWRNYLEREFLKYLKEINHSIIDMQTFQRNYKRKINQLNEQHPRCKKLSSAIHEISEDGDFRIKEQVAGFYILKVK